MKDHDQHDGEASVVERLLARMDDSPGFAGLGASVQVLSRLDDDDDGGCRNLAALILQDAALTGKLLRLANAGGRGGRNVSTIDQAIIVLGLNTVKSVAVSLALLDTLSNKPQSKQLHAEIAAAYFCGALAYEITRRNAPRFNAQEAQVCGLMQNLGRLMALYYLYDDIQRCHALQVEKNLTEDEAVHQMFGVGFDKLAVAIAAHWQLPDVLRQSLAPEVGKAQPRPPANALGWHQLCTLFAHRVTDALFRQPENTEKLAIAQEIAFFKPALSLKDDETLECIDRALRDTAELLSGIGFPCELDAARTLLRKGSERVLSLLSPQDSLAREGDGQRPIDIIQQVLRLLHQEFDFDRTLLLLPSGPTSLAAVAGVGRNAGQVSARFRCNGAKPDLFRLIMGKKVDLYVGDVDFPNYAKLLPDWYREVVDTQSFLLLSLLADGEFLGMVYGDFGTPHPQAPALMSQDSVRQLCNELTQVLRANTGRR
jgi:HD-like signal output (HDOD) protein